MRKQRSHTMYTTFVEIEVHISRLDSHMNRFRPYELQRQRVDSYELAVVNERDERYIARHTIGTILICVDENSYTEEVSEN